MSDRVDIIIPTYDNHDQLMQCVQSILAYRSECPCRIIIVNNGQEHIEQEQFPEEYVKVVSSGDNLGWTGGLKLGLQHSDSKYVMFANDDIYIPRASWQWLREMVRNLDNHQDVGAVGPSSNVVMGKQNIWSGAHCRSQVVPFLIGFCVLVRREALDKAGGVQDVEHGGDDLDLSIRIRNAGYLLLNCCNVFVYHHGFQTGNKVHGGADKPNGWNSREMIDNTNMELIRKHGFLEWWQTMTGQIEYDGRDNGKPDTEGDAVRSMCATAGDKVVEVGCGATKTVENAVGVDRIPKGEDVPYINAKSVADIVADVSSLPFEDNSQDCLIARHVLEHCIDPVATISEWKRVIRPGGRLVISCPDENITTGVPLNPEHLHAFTPDSIRSLAKVLGLSVVSVADKYNTTSFTVCLEKIR